MPPWSEQDIHHRTSPNLQSLKADYVDSLEPIADFKSLTRLSLKFQRDLDYSPLNDCKSLTELHLKVYKSDADAFAEKLVFSGIKKLVIDGDFRVDTTVFPVMDKLESLQLYEVGEMDGLLRQPKLRELLLCNCGQEKLKQLPKLLEIPTFEVVRSKWTSDIHLQRPEESED